MADSQPITTNLPLSILLIRISDRLEGVTDGLDALRVMAVSQTFDEAQEGALLFLSNGLDDRHRQIVELVEQARAAVRHPVEAPATPSCVGIGANA